MEERPKSYNIGWETVGDKLVSTAAIASSSPYFGDYFMTYETIIWEWGGEKRADMIHQIHHQNEENARKVHGYIVNNIKNKMSN